MLFTARLGRSLALATLLAGLLSLAPSGCKRASCDTDALDELNRALDQMPRSTRMEVAALGLVDACGRGENPLPGGLMQALRGINQAPPDMRDIVVFRGVATEIGLWTAVCPSGADAIATMAKLSPDEQTKALVEACDLASHVDFANRDELLAASPADVMLASLAYVYLEKNNNGADRARAAARGLLGR